MLYNPPTGSTDPNASFVGKNLAAGKQGSKVPPGAAEFPQREIVAAIVEAGLAPTNIDLAQLLKAIRGGQFTTFSDGGTVNALKVTPLTPHVQLFKGLPFRVFPAFTNTAACTLAVNQLSAALTRRDGSAVVAGDLIAGVPIDCCYDGLGAFRLLGVGFAETQRIVANPTLWVRTDGNDANDGSSNDGAHAFATIAAAVAATTKLATTGSGVTIALGLPGTYTAPRSIYHPGANFTIQGDATNQALYIIAGAGTASAQPTNVNNCSVAFVGVTLSNTGTVADTVGVVNGGSATFTNVTFTSIAGNGNYHIAAYVGGSVTLNGGLIFASSMGGWIKANGGSITLAPTQYTFTNAPAWANAGVLALTCGVVVVVGTPTFSGAPTGTRYAANSNGVIVTNGAGASFFPGSVAGTTATGGQYL